MILNMPVEDLLASQLDITLDANGRLSCKLKPKSSRNHDFSAPKSCQGVNINFESVPSENGYILSFYASPDETAPPPMVGDPAVSSPLAVQSFAHPSSVTDMEDNSPLSHPLSDSSPPPDYFSTYNDVPSPLLLQHGEFEHHQLDFEYASNCMSADVASDPNFNTHQFSELMGIMPSTYGTMHSSSPSDSSAAGSSRRASPFPSNAGAPSPASDTISPSESMSSSYMAAPGTPPSLEHQPPAENTASRTGRRAQYPCLHPTCDRVLTSPYTRQVHMGTHKAKVRKAFLCTLGCGEAFTRQHDRQRHEVALHGKKCKHVCGRCKRFFSSAKMLDRHVCRGAHQGVLQWPEEAQAKQFNDGQQ